MRKTDISLAKQVLGCEPRVAPDEGLRKTVDYFDNLLASKKTEPVEFATNSHPISEHAGHWILDVG